MADTAPAISLRNTLWLIAAFALVAAPHAERLPVWLSAIAAMMCFWRAYLARTRTALPARWLLVVIVIATAALIYLHYRTLFGRDAGVALLTLMLSLKLMETRSQRDGVVLAFISYFLVITNFFYTQSIPTALYLLGCVWVITAAMIGLQYTHPEENVRIPWRAPVRTAAIMLLQSVPLMLIFFVLFPRVQGPLWGMPSDAFAGVTGLSDSMSPGTINKLVFSEDVALRAEFTGPVPPSNKLYWRGPVLLEFDGLTWTSPPRPWLNRVDLDRRENPVRYSVTVEPHNRRWLFALDMPGALPQGSFITPDHLLMSQTAVVSRRRYDVVSYLDYTAGANSNEFMLRRALQLPRDFNPRTLELGRELRDRHINSGSNGGNDSIMNAALAFFREQKFTYTLEPPLLGRHSVDEFMFETRQGFCEHFSSAFVVLMRAAGVPARVVTGYLGGEYNPVGNYVIVRQSEAHAWAEVWIEQRGWVRIDPTNAASPMRADSGLSAALPEGAQLPRSVLRGRNAFFHQLGLRLDAIANAWNQSVLGYNLESQRALLYRAGLDGNTLRTLVMLLIGAMLIATAILAYLTLARHHRTRDPVLAAYQDFCKKMARAGLTRGDAEGPLDYAARVAQKRPEFAPVANEITRLYVALRYEALGNQVNINKNKHLQQLRQRVRAFAA